MARKIISLMSQRGQIFIEGLFFICCLLGFILTLNLFQQYANKEINSHRLKKSYKNHSQKRKWYSNQKKRRSSL